MAPKRPPEPTEDSSSPRPDTLLPGEAIFRELAAPLRDQPLIGFILLVGLILLWFLTFAGESSNLRFVVLAYTVIVIVLIGVHFAQEYLARKERRKAGETRLKNTADVRRARRFWKPFSDGPVQVVLGEHQQFTAYEASGFISVGEAIGLSELRAHLADIGMPDFSVTYAERASSNLRTHLVLIGGPDANSITREAVVRLEAGLAFGDPATHTITITDRITGQKYSPLRRGPDNAVTRDHGVIIRTPNPFERSKQLLVLAGSFGFGTWGAMRFLTSAELLDDRSVRSGDPFECLVVVDVVRNEPQGPSKVVLRRLEAPA